MIRSGSCLAAVIVASVAISLASRVDAAVIISMDNVSVLPGSTALVGVYASSTTGDVLSGVNLPLDINDDGFATLPTGFALSGTGLTNALYANTGLDTPQPQITLMNVDSIPTGSGGNTVLSATPTLLFDLAVSVSSSVAPGTVVPLEIEVPASPFSSLFNVAGPNTPTVSAPILGTPVNGSITVITVPEPTAAVTLATVLIAAMASSRRHAAK